MRISRRHVIGINGFFAILAMFLLLSSKLYAQATPSAKITPPQPATDPTDPGKAFLDSVEGRDLKAVFSNTYIWQERLRSIQSDNPQVLWRKLTDDLFDAFQKSFERGPIVVLSENQEIAADNLASLFSLLALRHVRTIIETRSGAWGDENVPAIIEFVSLKYDSPNASPIVASHLLKEAILALKFDKGSGRFLGAALLDKGNVFWDAGNPRIQIASWNSRRIEAFLPGGVSVTALVTGGAAPYNTVVKFAGREMKQEFKTPGTLTVCNTEDAHLPIQPQEAPIECLLTVTDAKNQTDAVMFTVVNSGGPFAYARNPYLDMFNAGKAKDDPERAFGLEAVDSRTLANLERTRKQAIDDVRRVLNQKSEGSISVLVWSEKNEVRTARLSVKSFDEGSGDFVAELTDRDTLPASGTFSGSELRFTVHRPTTEWDLRYALFLDTRGRSFAGTWWVNGNQDARHKAEIKVADLAHAAPATRN